MIPLMSKPRESLFDALNVPVQDDLTISVDEFDDYLPYTIDIYTGGSKVASLTKGDSYTLINGSFSIRPSSSIDDYRAYWQALDKDDNVVTSGSLDGNTITITDQITKIVFTSTTYGLFPFITIFNISGVGFSGGIFRALAHLYPDVEYFNHTMDFDYLTAHSGQKSVSNAVMVYLIKYGVDVPDLPIKVLSQKGINELAKVIWDKFGDAWTHIYDALTAQYNPIENYSMLEETTPDLTDEFGVSDDYQTSRDRNVNTNVDTETGLYGFNSTTSVPTGTGNTSGSALDNTENETETQTGSRIETHTGKTTVERSGNIGTTTSQMMVQSELDLRIKNHMEDIIFNDVDQILTTAGFAPILSETINFI